MTQVEYDEMKDRLIPELCQTLNSVCEARFSRSDVLYINEEKIDAKNYATYFLNLFGKEPFTKFAPLLNCPSGPMYFFHAFKTAFKAFKTRNRTSQWGSENVANFSYHGFLPFISIHDGNQVVFFHGETGEIVDLDYKTYQITTPKEDQQIPVRAVVHFNPYRPEQIYVQDTGYGTCSHINTYKKPEWQIGRQLSSTEEKTFVKLPYIIDEFFTHMFPDKRCREYVYDWLHFSLVDRCETYLCLNGAKGIGKGILSEMICKTLLGKENHKLAPQGVFESIFNSVLDKCRMIVFDEIKVDDEDKVDRLKRFINKEQMIERKGQDVGKTTETYNSFMICNNAETDMRIAWDDRRFSVADMTQVKLDDAWTKEKRDDLIAVVSDANSEEMQSFGYWLMYRVPVVMEDNFTPWKGAHFYKLCYTSLPEWAKMLVDEVTSGKHDELDEGELRLLYKDRTNGMGRLPNRVKIQDFLKNYKHEGKYYLGDLEVDERAWKIIIAEKFIKETDKDSTGIEWEDVL